MNFLPGVTPKRSSTRPTRKTSPAAIGSATSSGRGIVIPHWFHPAMRPTSAPAAQAGGDRHPAEARHRGRQHGLALAAPSPRRAVERAQELREVHHRRHEQARHHPGEQRGGSGDDEQRIHVGCGCYRSPRSAPAFRRQLVEGARDTGRVTDGDPAVERALPAVRDARVTGRAVAARPPRRSEHRRWTSEAALPTKSTPRPEAMQP